VPSNQEVFQLADIVLMVDEPGEEEYGLIRKDQIIVTFFNLSDAQPLIDAVQRAEASLMNMNLVPRISRAQKLDSLSSMANLAGYRAVLDGFTQLPRIGRACSTSSGSLPPAKVLILGTGVAGLSAIATARGMGAEVSASDVRAAAREQVEAMGAKFVAIEAPVEGEGVGGYAVEVGEVFRAMQLATYARLIKDMDLVITTALIPGRPAPLLVTAEMARSMKRGSVVVDMAAASGGNCDLSQANQIVTDEVSGVVIVGKTNYPAEMAGQASYFLSQNFLALLQLMGEGKDLRIDLTEPVVEQMAVVRTGELLSRPPPMAVTAAGGPGPSAGPSPPPPDGTASNGVVLKWLEENAEECAIGFGLLTAALLGLTLPPHEVQQIGNFILATLIGHFTVASVTPSLHTPLIAVTNAISGIIVVGGLLELGGPVASAKVMCSLLAVFFATLNIAGGFAVADRMIRMFKSDVDLNTARPTAQ
jgi:NAD(P) transhydrogenase alpha subunit